LNHFQAQVAEW